MIQEGTELAVADNSGARRVACFRVLGQRKKYAHLGDLIRVAVKEAQPTGMVKKGQVCLAVIIRQQDFFDTVRRGFGTRKGHDDE